MDFVRKAEEAITGKKGESHESTKSSNHGPHKSNLANKLDPRVDSDKDNRAAHTDVTAAGPGTTHGTTSATGTGSSTLGYGATHGPSGATSTGTAPTSPTRLIPVSTLTVTTVLAMKQVSLALGLVPVLDLLTLPPLQARAMALPTAPLAAPLLAPHSSNIANKADPRVDSDRDNRARHGGLTGAGTAAGTAAGVGSTLPTTAPGTHGSTLSSGTGATHSTTHGAPIATPGSSSTNAGPHSSNIANKLDPRVDSDRDNRARHEALAGTGTAAGVGSTHGTTHGTSRVTDSAGLGSTHGTTATGTHGSTLGSGTTHGTSSTTGPHGSNIANKIDPRVDSDRDNRAQHQSTLAGTAPGTATHGTHTRGATAPTGLAIGDPSYDTGALAGSSYNTPANTPATGTTTGATGTAGPHGSSIANKLDPRVDSDATRAQNEGLQRKI
ncbi:hypothetical protein N7497_009200 [Penicillium chrysogenum]|nr:hypothetical protein N7497_009200 [Penicillium chrysogenum]